MENVIFVHLLYRKANFVRQKKNIKVKVLNREYDYDTVDSKNITIVISPKIMTINKFNC